MTTTTHTDEAASKQLQLLQTTSALKQEFDAAQSRWSGGKPSFYTPTATSTSGKMGRRRAPQFALPNADPMPIEAFELQAEKLISESPDPSRPERVWTQIRKARSMVLIRESLKRKPITTQRYAAVVARDRREGWWRPDVFSESYYYYAAAYEGAYEDELKKALENWSRAEKATGKPREHLALACATVLQAAARLGKLRRDYPRDHKAGVPAKLRAGEKGKLSQLRKAASARGELPRPPSGRGARSKGEDMPQFPRNFVQLMLDQADFAEFKWGATMGVSMAIHLSTTLRNAEHLKGITYMGRASGILEFVAPTAKDRSGHNVRPVRIPEAPAIGKFLMKRIDAGTIVVGQRIQIKDGPAFSKYIKARARAVLGDAGKAVSSSTIRHAIAAHEQRLIHEDTAPLLQAARKGEAIDSDLLDQVELKRAERLVALSKRMGHASDRHTTVYGGHSKGSRGIAPTALVADSGKAVKVNTRSVRTMVEVIQGGAPTHGARARKTRQDTND